MQNLIYAYTNTTNFKIYLFIDLLVNEKQTHS